MKFKHLIKTKMGTTGLYAFIYKGFCYVFYNEMNSNLEALGEILVIMIKTENYKKWGDVLIDKIENKNYKIRKLKYEFNNYVEYVSDEKQTNINTVMDKNEWIKTIYTIDGSNYIYLKWDFCDLIKNCEITKNTIKTICPSLQISSFVTKFKVTDNFYINDILKLNTGEWIYIIDLDIQVFEIQLYESKTITFPLDNIPFNWKEKVKEKYNKI